MPIQEGKYVTPAWQNGGPPAIDAAELTAIGNSIVTNQNNILTNTQNIQTNQQDIEALQSTVQNINGNYLNKTGDTMSGQLNMGGNIITNLGAPSSSTDAVTKEYVDGLNKLNWELVQKSSFSIPTTTNTRGIYTFEIATSDYNYKQLIFFIKFSTCNFSGFSEDANYYCTFRGVPIIDGHANSDGNISYSGEDYFLTFTLRQTAGSPYNVKGDKTYWASVPNDRGGVVGVSLSSNPQLILYATDTTVAGNSTDYTVSAGGYITCYGLS